MPLSIAFQMDHVSGIRIAGDTTFALMLEAQRRGHRLLHYTPDRLAMEGRRLSATVEPVEVADEEGRHASLGKPFRLDLAEADVVFMRQDPPFDLAYITATHLLEAIHPKTLVVNDPAHVRNAPEKLLVTEFPDLMPATLVTRDRAAIAAFRAEHRDIILKPLFGNGGAAVFRLGHEDENFAALVELFEQSFREPFVVQQYLPAVRAGDKRIILVDGEAVGAINRVPAKGDARSNLHVGGRAEPTEISDREREICRRLAPEMRARGFLLVGIDVIGGYLTEINVTSPTGVREVKRFGGADIPALVLDAVEARAG